MSESAYSGYTFSKTIDVSDNLSNASLGGNPAAAKPAVKPTWVTTYSPGVDDLRWRLPGYDPERNLAGVLYLFLRGMVGPETPTIDGTPWYLWEYDARAQWDWHPPDGPFMRFVKQWYPDAFQAKRDLWGPEAIPLHLYLAEDSNLRLRQA